MHSTFKTTNWGEIYLQFILSLPRIIKLGNKLKMKADFKNGHISLEYGLVKRKENVIVMNKAVGKVSSYSKIVFYFYSRLPSRQI